MLTSEPPSCQVPLRDFLFFQIEKRPALLCPDLGSGLGPVSSPAYGSLTGMKGVLYVLPVSPALQDIVKDTIGSLVSLSISQTSLHPQPPGAVLVQRRLVCYALSCWA